MEIIAHFQFVTLKLLPVHANAGDVNVKADQYPALPIYILKSCGWPQLRMALLNIVIKAQYSMQIICAFRK